MLEIDLPWMENIQRAIRPIRVPIVLSRDEVGKIFDNLEDVYWLVASLLYGSGMRLLECLRLRVQDLDFARGEIAGCAGRKYPAAVREWRWQYVFPATHRQVDSTDGVVRRHHLHESAVQGAMIRTY